MKLQNIFLMLRLCLAGKLIKNGRTGFEAGTVERKILDVTNAL